MQKAKMVMKQPDLSVSKGDAEKADKLFDNFANGALREVSREASSFSTWSMIRRMLAKSKIDPSEKHIFEIIKRMDKDKVPAPVALHISETATRKIQNLQKITLIKMIPFFVGMLGLIILGGLILATKPLLFTNPVIQRYLIMLALMIPLLVWGLRQRKDAKFDMIATNILLQASSAYASAKFQGKGQIAAMQNLDEMRRRAKSMEAKNKAEAKSKDKK